MQLWKRIAVLLGSLKAVPIAAFIFAGILFSPVGVLNAGSLDTLKELTAGVDTPAFPIPSQSQEADLVRVQRPLKVYFIEVGQGDAAYIEFPGGSNALIDAGPSRAKNGKLASFLTEHNVAKIDNVVLTHPHADHYTGLRYVFSHIPVTNFFDTRVDNVGTSIDETIREEAVNLGMNIVYPSAGDTLPWAPGEAEVKVLSSCSSPLASGSGEILNNCSMVLKITYQNTSILFTGDAQERVEKVLLQRYGPELRSGVLKVGHHGSEYSSGNEFLAAVKPHDAYISVGKNSYGHPMPDCLSRLQNAGAIVHRTDIEGTLEYTIGARAASVEEEISSLKY